MSTSDGSLASRNRRGLRTLLRLRNPPASSTDQNPLISSLPPLPIKKKAFASSAFRSLSCSSSAASQAYVPSSGAAAVRSSAEWEGRHTRRRRTKLKKKNRPSATADVWCAPGISFVGDDSVDCVVSHREVAGRGGRLEVGRNLLERTYYARRDVKQEPVSFMADSISSLQASPLGSDLMPSERCHHMRGYYHHSPAELEEVEATHPSLSYLHHDLSATIMLLHHRFLLRGGDAHDRYRDWRLDVDHMTYEELLELGDRIGHVSTGLREEQIACIIRKVKHSIFDDKRLSTEMERKCSICQEEYETDYQVGKLGCGHSYHIYCIKKWLLQKNVCPLCKTAVGKT